MTVFIQEAGDVITARMHASLAGNKGEFVEYHVLTPKMVKRIPKKTIGCVSSEEEAEDLLKKLG